MSEVQDAVIRLTAWLRDYGHQCNMPTFPADIAAVVEAAKYSPEWRDSAPAKTIERFSLEWYGLPHMQSQHMENDPEGDWCKWEDVKRVFDLCEYAVFKAHTFVDSKFHKAPYHECTDGLCGEWEKIRKGAAT